MTHIPNKLDVAADLRRCLYSSYSDLVFDDGNVKVFLQRAENNLGKLKKNIDKKTLDLVEKMIQKAKNSSSLPERRREDLLLASCLLY